MTAFVRAAALGSYPEVARRAGLDPVPMLRGAGLEPGRLADPDARLPAATVVALLEESARRAHRETLGLEMAESWRMSDFGALSLLLAHQRTLRAALEATIRYRHLLNDTVTMSIEDEGGLVILREELVAEGGAASSRQAIELALGVVFRIFRALLGPDWKPRAVRFVHPPPREPRVHRRIFGPNVHFNAEFNGIVCVAADLDRPNPSADPAMAGHAQRYLESLPGAGDASVVQEVRRTIHVLLPRGRASIEHVAGALHTHPRALQRRLEAEGESFTALLDASRRALVERYLDNPAYSLTQVSELLGYGFPSSFTRWFVGAFGVSPATWRARRGARKGPARAKLGQGNADEHR